MLRFYTLDNSQKWDNVVRSFENYDVFYLSSYVRAFQLEDSKNGEPVLFLYENGEDRAVNVVYKRDAADEPGLSGKIEHGKYIDLITPYGYGGFMGNVTDWDNLNEEYLEFCIGSHFVCEFVRFGLFSEYSKHYDGKIETHSHNIVRNLRLSSDEIWRDFKPKVRKNVNRARTYNLEIIQDKNGEYLDDFLHIYYSTMKRADAEDRYYFSKKFYKVINQMEDNIIYFHVLYKGKIISSELVIYGAENAYSFLGGTEKEYFELRPNDFLKYQIIEWCRERGLKNFVLGGGYGKDDGIYQYKKNLAPNGIVDFYIGKKIFDNDVYNELVRIQSLGKEKDNDISFFPAYRK